MRGEGWEVVQIVVEARMRISMSVSVFRIRSDISSRSPTHIMERKDEGFSVPHISCP